MEVNEHVRDQIFEIIEKQMKDNTPPEVNLTYKRLKDQGCTDFVAKQYIGQCLAMEIFGALKNQEPYNEARYIKNLKTAAERTVFVAKQNESVRRFKKPVP